jgi:hypothetical protein
MNNIYKEVSNKTSLPIEVVKIIYESYFNFIRKTISELSIEEIDNINNYKTSFNIPSIGKLYCNKNKLYKIK